MGICKSKTNLQYHSVESANPLHATAALQSIIIYNAQNVSDAASDKIHTLQERHNQHKLTYENLKKQLTLLENQQKQKDQIAKKYKTQLEIQRSAIFKREQKIQFISVDIENIKQERKKIHSYEDKNYLLSIGDTLYKVHGTNISKLKWNKESKKFVVFTAAINCLFYYDETGLKHMNVHDISVNNNSIQNKMNKPWFLVIGKNRSALFAANNVSIRDKWVNFIKQSLNKQNNSR
eukprot:330816_1